MTSLVNDSSIFYISPNHSLTQYQIRAWTLIHPSNSKVSLRNLIKIIRNFNKLLKSPGKANKTLWELFIKGRQHHDPKNYSKFTGNSRKIEGNPCCKISLINKSFYTQVIKSINFLRTYFGKNIDFMKKDPRQQFEKKGISAFRFSQFFKYLEGLT